MPVARAYIVQKEIAEWVNSLTMMKSTTCVSGWDH
jgi:hypothetical protein